MTDWGPQTDFGLSTDEMREAVDIHLSRHIGDFETAFCDEDGWAGASNEDGPPVDILVVPPEGERRFAYVTTFGCAFRPLPAEPYANSGVNRRVEFVLAAQQSGDDDDDLKALNLAANTVRQFAKLVHLNGITVEYGETVAFSDDPKPVYDNAKFCAFAFMPPRLPGPGFETWQPSNVRLGEPLRYIAPVPIYREELDFGIDNGPEALLELLVDSGVTEMIDLGRTPSQPRQKSRADKAAKRARKAEAEARRVVDEGLMNRAGQPSRKRRRRGIFGWLFRRK